MMRAKAIPKVEGRANPTKNVFDVDVLATPEPIAKPRLTLMEDLRNLHPGEEVSEIVRKKAKHIAKCAVGHC